MVNSIDRSKELDFSEKACIERYVHYPYFDEENEDPYSVSNLYFEDKILNCIRQNGFIAADLDVFETRSVARRTDILISIKNNKFLYNLLKHGGM